MSITAVIGLFYGNEGKIKTIHHLNVNGFNGDKFSLCVRAQGGPNTGHVVKIKDKTFKLHTIPYGILVPGMHCLIAHGCVVHPEKLLDEIRLLTDAGITDILDRLHIASSAHIIIDQPNNNVADGITSTYSNKIIKDGIRMEFLASEEPWTTMVVDGVHFMIEAMRTRNNILIEGTDSILLDNDIGTYPFVSSSNTTISGIMTGTGIPPRSMKNIVGVMKAYTTRNGNGPLPTEILEDDVLNHLRVVGNEYGLRSCRYGWLDIPQLLYSCWINGITHISMNKFNVLTGISKIMYCTHYKRVDGLLLNSDENDIYTIWPSDWKYVINRYEPVYKEYPGWTRDISKIREFDDLPENAKKFITGFERDSKIGISMIGVGPEHDDIIYR